MGRPPHNRVQPGGAKHVPSSVPDSGPIDAAGRVNAHRGVNEGPTTVGVNPNPPARRLTSDDETETTPLTSGTPAASGQATSFPPYGGNY